MSLFYILLFLLLVQSLLSLRGGRDYVRYVRDTLARPRNTDFTPLVTIFAPCRGLDQGLRENLAALFRQDYPRYEIVFVTDSNADPSCAVIRQLQQEFTAIPAKLVSAGAASDCGQKVHNLRVAITHADPQSEIFAFVDSDARPRADWLRNLVAPLSDEKLGAATGYRWFVPVRGGWASHLRAVWNASIASALGPNGKRNFCWGGATALRRTTFEQLEMLEKWRGTLSDDFALTHALHAADLPIYFVPQCLTASHEDCTARDLWEFTTRQIKITRVYAPHLWQIVLFSNLLFALAFGGGWLLAVWRWWHGQPSWTIVLPLFLLYVLGSVKAALRWQAVRAALASVAMTRTSGLWQVLAWPLSSALFAANALAAARSRRISWRGTTYEMAGPTQTRILAQPD